MQNRVDPAALSRSYGCPRKFKHERNAFLRYAQVARDRPDTPMRLVRVHHFLCGDSVRVMESPRLSYKDAVPA